MARPRRPDGDAFAGFVETARRGYDPVIERANIRPE
jgi:hypothetical protein